MQYILSVSKLMKASEVSKLCKEGKKNAAQLLCVEFEYRKKIQEMNKEKAAS
jgi:hypothetical protein